VRGLGASRARSTRGVVARQGKTRARQQVRCNTGRDDGRSQEQQSTAEEPDNSSGWRRRARKGRWDSSSLSLLSFLQALLTHQSRGRAVERPERPLIGRIASHLATDTGA
jgi:hypothetical protein